MLPNVDINSSLMDDMHQEGDYISSSEKKASEIGAEMIPGQPDDGNTPEVNDALAVLEGHDAEVQVTHDDLTKVFDMRETATRILAQESISQGDAEEIQRVYGSLEDEVAPVATFTEVPTKVNLDTTKAWIADKLESHFAEARNRHLDYIGRTEEYAKRLLTSLAVSIPEVLDDIESLRVVALADLSKAGTSKNFLVYRARRNTNQGQPPELVDLRRQALYNQNFVDEFEPCDILADLPTSTDIIALRETYFSKAFSILAKKAGAGREELLALHNAYHGDGAEDQYVRSLSYIELLSLLSTGVIGEFITEAYAKLLPMAEEIGGQKASLLAAKLENTPEATEKLSQSALALSDYYELLLQLEKFRTAVYMFNYRAKVVLDAFRKVLDKA